MAGNNALSIIAPYLVTGNPDTVNVTPPTQLTGGGNPPGSFFPYAPGDLGEAFEIGDKTYELAFCDSGATSATPTGAVAANQLAFWKSKVNRIVTNDRRFAFGNTVANGSGNFVAGIFRVAAGAGNLICVLTKGHAISVKCAVAATAGMILTADVDSNGPQVVGVAVGTAPGYLPVAVSRQAQSGSTVVCDVNIPSL